ncbi:MAG: hypothetical protein QXJ17_01525 [Nitrososphaeria archaeon]
MSILREDGWFCSRSAMSHSPVDIFAGKNGKTRLIQVKGGRARIRRNERDELCKWAKAFGAEAEIWYLKKGEGIVKEKIGALPS